jgi:TRAP-type mannitol/chloroaromatic compound transport system permease small subunit
VPPLLHRRGAPSRPKRWWCGAAARSVHSLIAKRTLAPRATFTIAAFRSVPGRALPTRPIARHGPPRKPQEPTLTALLRLSGLIDKINLLLGKVIMWLVLGAVVISAGNAILRKTFNIGSNAWLEIQWYLFAGVFMLGVGYVMLKNAHVRIDFISSKLSKRTNAIIDAIGIVVFTIPLALIMVKLGWPLFERAWSTGEMSQNAGGLIRWPVLALLPVGFLVLFAAATSELIKRIAFLRGVIPEPFTNFEEKSEEEKIAEALAVEAEKREATLAAAAAAAASKTN